MEPAAAEQSPTPERVPTAVTAATVAAIGVLVATTFLGLYDASAATGLLGLDIATGVGACALVPVLLRRPAPGAALLAVLAVVSPVATPAATAGSLVVARWRPLPVATALALTGVAAHAVQGVLRPTGGLSYGWWLVLVVVAHAALVSWGRLARTRATLIASLRERARRAEDEQAGRVAAARAQERTLIAREMHDVLAHRLSLLAAYAGALEFRPDAPPEQLARAAGVVRDGVHRALDELRGVIGVLRAGDPDPDRPSPELGDLTELVGESRAAGTPVEVDDRVVATVPAAVGRTAYRIVQEGLTNARRHAPGRPVHVRLAGGPGTELVVEIRNPLPAGPSPAVGTGTGLVGLTERAALAGGRLEHGATPTGEFRLHAALPWPG